MESLEHAFDKFWVGVVGDVLLVDLGTVVDFLFAEDWEAELIDCILCFIHSPVWNMMEEFYLWMFFLYFLWMFFVYIF